MSEQHAARAAAIGIALQTAALLVWSGLVLASGLAGESVVTADGSEVPLAILGFVIALILAAICYAVWRGHRWSTGPGITLEILFIGGVLMSGDFLNLPQRAGLLVLGLATTGLLVYLRVAQERRRGGGRAR